MSLFLFLVVWFSIGFYFPYRYFSRLDAYTIKLFWNKTDIVTTYALTIILSCAGPINIPVYFLSLLMDDRS